MKSGYTITLKSIAACFLICLLGSTTVQAYESMLKKSNVKTKSLVAGCKPSSSSADLDINNVRAKLLNGGDFWWSRKVGARYEVPKIQPGSGIAKNSIYSGALWFGGYQGTVLRTAGQTYSAGTSDEFWPGPLDTVTATITPDACLIWDKHFKVSSFDTLSYKEGTASGKQIEAIEGWPAATFAGDTSAVTTSLAPYRDNDHNGTYNPVPGKADSDVPNFRGDQAIWWVMNDKGDTHQHYQGNSIGLEIQALAFAFSTNDELNNMTFYKYKVINRASTTLDSTFMGLFVDPDLGDYFDDYIGCDAELGVGYVYNGDDNDGTNLGYGQNPPALGVDFFQGPTNEKGVQLPMTRFMYFTNATDNGPQTDPAKDTEMYNYLTGSWRTPVRLTYGGTGLNPSSTDYADFAFPGKTDPKGRPEWSEYLIGNTPGDRRFVESSGPFKLLPGAVNEIIVGVVWARASTGGAIGSLQAMLDADFKAQELFNAGFQIVEGPTIPDLVATELDQKLVLNLYNTKATESYSKIEVTGFGKYKYDFEGYQIYQLKDNTVTSADLSDGAKAQLIFECDLKNGIRDIVNTRYDAFTEQSASKKMVRGQDNGISHTFVVTTDAFNNGLPIVNNKQYYFLLVAYSYSKDARMETGPKKGQFSAQYLAGIKRAKSQPNVVLTAIASKTEPRYGGTVLNAEVGINPKATRYSGAGNGGNYLDLSEETDISELFTKGIISNPVYKSGGSPLSIRVIDPFKVPDANFKLEFLDDSYSGPGMKRWKITNLTSGETVLSDTTLGVSYSQVIPKWGVAISIDTVTKKPGQDMDNNANGFLGAAIEYSDPNDQWFKLVQNNTSVYSGQYWIRAYNSSDDKAKPDDLKDQDNNEFYRNILKGTICPYKFAETAKGPGVNSPQSQANSRNNLNDISSIDLVLTPDKSKWSQCVVVDCSSTSVQPAGKKGEHNEIAGALRNEEDTTGNATGIGRSVFPGYAINMETGQRLNVFFAEFSKYTNPIARDMIFNPNMDTTDGFNGGRQYIYVTNSVYDSCHAIQSFLSQPSIAAPSAINISKAFGTVGWTMVPLADPKRFLNSEVKIKVRVAKPLQSFQVAAGKGAAASIPYYEFTTKDLAPLLGNKEAAKNALDLVNIVPNPYYAYSTYEQSKTDSRVRITNLPPNVILSIYNLGGSLVKRIEKDNANANYVEWDLRNEDNVPISSGMYIIHVKAPGIGERSLKWFGVMRPIDLDNF